jgi:hypothetical protein
MGDFGIEKEIVIVGGLEAAAAADRGVTGFTKDNVGAAEDKRQKNSEASEENQSADEQESSVTAFHTVEGKAKWERKQAESAATKLIELRVADCAA